MADEPLTCLILSDGRRGIENQAVGLAEAASRLRPLDIVNHKIENGAAFIAASPSLQYALKSKPADYGIKGTPPEIAVGCGRQAIAPLMALKKTYPDIFTVYIQDPRIELDPFDLVIAPEHDQLEGPNVESMIGSPNRLTETELISQVLNFADQLATLPMPRAAILIGGTSKTHKLGKAEHAEHLKAARDLKSRGYSLLITTSRRTPSWAVKDYKELEENNETTWVYTGNGPNPYFAFLGGADIILVTEDSTNMLTEAASTGKAVYTLPMQGKAGKFQQLYDRLMERCHIRPHDGDLNVNPYEPLNETQRVAERFWVHYDVRNAAIN